MKYLLAAALVCLSLAAHAQAVSMYWVSAGTDTNACVFAQFGSSTWYAVSRTDPAFSAVNAMLLTSYTTGLPITFNTGGTTCGVTQLHDLYLGVLQ